MASNNGPNGLTYPTLLLRVGKNSKSSDACIHLAMVLNLPNAALYTVPHVVTTTMTLLHCDLATVRNCNVNI